MAHTLSDDSDFMDDLHLDDDPSLIAYNYSETARRRAQQENAEMRQWMKQIRGLFSLCASSESTPLVCTQQILASYCRKEAGGGAPSPDAVRQCTTACRVLRQLNGPLWDKMEECQRPLISCVKDYTVYARVFPPAGSDTERHWSAGTEFCQRECSKTWWMETVPDTNLHLIAVQTSTQTAECNCACASPYRSGREVKFNNSVAIQEVDRINPPWSCKPIDTKENKTTCSGLNPISPPSGHYIITWTVLVLVTSRLILTLP